MHWWLRTAAMLLVTVLTACGTAPDDGLYPSSSMSAKTAAEANANLGLGYMQQGNYNEALVKLNRALKMDPELARAHHYIAELYNRLEQQQLADKHFVKSLTLDPQDAAAQNNYGVFLCAQGRFTEAEPHFLAAVRNPLYSGRAGSYENAGVCAAQSADNVSAEKYLRAALKLNPRLPKSLYQMAGISYQEQNYLQARAYLQRFEAVAAPGADSLWLGFRIEKQNGNNEAAADYAQQLEQSNSGYAPWRQYQADGVF